MVGSEWWGFAKPVRPLRPRLYEVPRRHDSVRMPKESWGECVVKVCRRVEYLADGLCVVHWDKGLDKKVTC